MVERGKRGACKGGAKLGQPVSKEKSNRVAAVGERDSEEKGKRKRAFL